MTRYIPRALGAATAAMTIGTFAVGAQTPVSHGMAETACMTVGMDHGTLEPLAHQVQMTKCGALPTQPAQSAYATLGEVVRLLKADPATDWSKVDLEALRQHLIDMDDVIMRSDVTQSSVPGGLAMTVTGTGRTEAAIKRMVKSHAMMLGQDSVYAATAEVVPHGVRLTVTARSLSDTTLVAMIRGMGFAGLITEGDHHAKHHMALARGAAGTMSH